MRSRLISAVVSLAVSCGALAGVGVSWAVAGPAVPAWQVASRSNPTYLPPGGTGTIEIDVSNVGDAASSGPVTVIDTLPPGLTAVEFETSQEGVAAGFGEGSWGWDCSGTTVVTCTNDPVLFPEIPPYASLNRPFDFVPSSGAAETLVIVVSVVGSASGTADNVVGVSGGGAVGAAIDRQPVTVSPAPAPPGLTSFRMSMLNRDGSPDLQAGSHPYEMTTSFAVDSASGVNNGSRRREKPAGLGLKDLEVDLPVGFVGDPTATPRCSRQKFDVHFRPGEGASPRCPGDTQVGLATIVFGQILLTFPVYNLVPPAGVPAQFGFADLERSGIIDAGVRTGPGYGLKVNLRNIVQTNLLYASLTLWGVPSDPSHDAQRGCEGASAGGYAPCPEGEAARGEPLRPFLTNATSCGAPEVMGVSGDAWLEPENVFTQSSAVTDTQGNTVSLSGCEKLPFNPTVTLAAETTATNSPTGLEVGVHVPQNDEAEGFAEANLRTALVRLPAGMVLSPSAATGLGACSEQQIGLDNSNPVACSASSKVGTVQVDTPLLSKPLTGGVYLAQQGNAGAAQGTNPFGSLIALYVVAEGSGVRVKLAARVAVDPLTGQVTTSFENLPQLPYSDVTLHLFGGARAALMTPSSCGTYSASTQLTPWSSETPASLSNAIQVDGGCGAPGFSPGFVAGTSNAQAGAFSPLSVSFSRQDGEQTLGGVQVKTPPGVLGILKGVERCPEPQASQGTCSAGSLIGHTTVTAGPGPDPVTVQGGQVFLTGSYKGAPFGLSIVVPAVAGPFNLGNVIVRAAIGVDPNTSQLTVTSDPLPSILQGIPLQIRSVNVIVDRAGFTFNPTDCEPLSVGGTLTSTQGATANVSSRFQAANCAALSFHPSFSVSSQAKTSKASGASLDVKVGSGAGQANIGKVAVSLPKQLPSRLTTIQQACTAAVFDQNPAGCPAGSDIGVATALTPVLAGPLTGPAYLVSHGGAAFPDVVVILQGEGITLDLTGSVNIKGGVTSSAFDAVPDAPISSFELSLPEGPHSALATNLPGSAKGSLCGQTLAMPTTIIGQNGAVIKQSTKISVTGCPKAKKVKKHKAQHKRVKKGSHKKGK